MIPPFPWHYFVPPFARLFDLATDLLLAIRPDPYWRFCPPRWAYRAVLFTFPISWPALLLIAIAVLPFLVVEALIGGIVGLLADLWGGGY